MTTFTIKTLGCKVNQFESETLTAELTARGLRPSGGDETADVCIINTCTVTRKASMQSRQAIRQAVRANPGARILVTGCYAQTEPEAIRRIEGVHDIIGRSAMAGIPDRIRKAEDGGRKTEDRGQRTEDHCAGSPDLRVPPSAFSPQPSAYLLKPSAFFSRTRPYLKIQDGCNAFCTYCIVPHARGRSRSLPPAAVLEALRHMKENGRHEAVLTGIHLGHYGLDLKPETRLAALLEAIEKDETPERIRLSSIEPAEVSDELIERVAGSPRFCRHFHIPLQSGDNGVLKRMNRPYTREQFADRVLRIHDRLPDATIGADVLVGFPGETDKAFQQTLSLIASLPVTHLHVFPFSPRKGTPAFHFPDPISPAAAKDRCSAVRALGREKKKAFYRRQVGREETILIEEVRDASTGLLKGLTSSYIPVMIEGGDPLKNTLTRVRIRRFHGEAALFGDVLAPL